MYRKRPFRPRKPVDRRIAGRRNRPIPPKLVEANKLFREANYAQAGELFEEIAQKGLERGILQAPALFIRAGECFVNDNDPDRGKRIILRGFNLFLIRRQWRRLKRNLFIVHQRMGDEYKEIINDVDIWVEKNVPAEIQASKEWKNEDIKPETNFKLPSICDKCGAPLNPREIDWFDRCTPVCAYCGSIIENGK